MLRLRYLPVLAALAALSACDRDEAPVDLDGAIPPLDGSASDAASDACYREGADGSNNVDAEPTGLARGVGPVRICGAVDVGHPGGVFLDVDTYEIAVTVAGPAVVRLTAPGAGALTRFDLIVRNETGRLAVGRVFGGLGVAVLPLSAGSHVIAVEAQGPAQTPIPYQIEIVDDEPTARCPIDSGPMIDYREADESGAGHRANDVVAVRTTPAILTNLTALATDAPEMTSLAVSAGGRKNITGLSADVVPADDPYHDRDTFAVYTGQSTNLLEVRAAWPGTAADLDVFLFEAEHADDPIGRPIQLFTGELQVTAVKPSTLYWIWVGGSARSSQLPASYVLSICGHEVAVGAGLSH